MMQLKVKRLNPAAILPSYARAGDAGLDLFAVKALSIAPGASALVKWLAVLAEDRHLDPTEVLPEAPVTARGNPGPTKIAPSP